MTLCVLIVEDEPLIAMDLRAILEDAGHQVAGHAARMREAMEIAASTPLDLAILDFHIAGRHNGVDVARRLREEHGVASLFVSATSKAKLDAMAAEWQPVGFIGKPFVASQIVEALSSVQPRLSSIG